MTATIQSILEQSRPSVARLCERLSVNELRLFGSAVGDSFDPETSDVDVVVDFRDHDKPGIADRYMQLVEGLEGIFHRHVDLVTSRSIRNPYFRRIIDETSCRIYAA